MISKPAGHRSGPPQDERAPINGGRPAGVDLFSTLWAIVAQDASEYLVFAAKAPKQDIIHDDIASTKTPKRQFTPRTA